MPEFSRQPGDEIVKIDGNISLECRASSVPLPDFVWYKNGNKMINNGSHTITSDEGYSRLNIWNAKNEDNGTYQCEAFNTADRTLSSRSAIISLVVQGNKFNYRKMIFVYCPGIYLNLFQDILN